MVSSPKSSQRVGPQDVAQGVCENETHIHVIVCSCSSSTLTKNIQLPRAKTHITTLPEIPHLRVFISKFKPHDTTSLNTHQLLSRGGLQVHDLVVRSKKYIKNPLNILGLANKTRIYSQGLLNPQLWFNIAVVIVWLLIRRTLEIFGINLPGLAVTPQCQETQREKRHSQSEETNVPSKEHDFVHLDAPWVD